MRRAEQHKGHHVVLAYTFNIACAHKVKACSGIGPKAMAMTCTGEFLDGPNPGLKGQEMLSKNGKG